MTRGRCLISLVVTTSMKTRLSAQEGIMESSKKELNAFPDKLCTSFRGLGTEVCRRSEELAVDLGCTHTYAIVTGGSFFYTLLQNILLHPQRQVL